MINNTGKFLRQRRIELKLTLKEVANKVGVAESTISMWESGKIDSMRANKLNDLAEILQCKPMNILNGSLDNDKENSVDLKEILPMVKIPVFNSVAAGLGCYADSKPIGYEIMSLSPAEAAESLCLTVEGDSMYPKIENGDLIRVHKQSSVDSGSLAVVLIDGEEGCVKRIVYGDTWIELHSINDMYPPRVFRDRDVLRIQVVGLVKDIIRHIG